MIDDTPAGSVIVVGSYVHDHVWSLDRFLNPGETRRALGFAAGPGGKGFNQAVACARQGARTLFIGAIGDDALGQAARAFAHGEGLDCRWFTCVGMPTAAAGIIVDASGANQIVVSLAANERLAVDFLLAHGSAFENVAVLLVQLENNLDAVRGALALATAHGLLRVLNPAPMHDDLDATLLAACDIVTPNETEFAQLLRLLAGVVIDADRIAALADPELHRLCRLIDVPSVVVTLGAAGCFVSHRADALRGDGEPFHRVAAERVRTVDSTGAGDAFNGALAAMLARAGDAPFADCVRHANRCAALSTEKPGAAPAMPRIDEVTTRFAPR